MFVCRAVMQVYEFVWVCVCKRVCMCVHVCVLKIGPPIKMSTTNGSHACAALSAHVRPLLGKQASHAPVLCFHAPANLIPHSKPNPIPHCLHALLQLSSCSPSTHAPPPAAPASRPWTARMCCASLATRTSWSTRCTSLGAPALSSCTALQGPWPRVGGCVAACVAVWLLV